MLSPWHVITFKCANPSFMRFNFCDVYLAIQPIVRKENGSVFRAETKRGTGCSALTTVNTGVAVSHGRL